MQTIKNLSIALLSMASLALVACQEKETQKAPELTITQEEVTETSVTFTISASNADEAAYMLVEGTAAVPSAEQILAEGEPAETRVADTYTIDGLAAETDYVVAAVAATESGRCSDVKTIEFTTSPSQAEEVNFEVSIALKGEPESSRISVTVTPSDETMPYYIQIYDREEVVDLDDNAIQEYIINQLSEAASLEGLTLRQYLPELLKKGTQDVDFEELVGNKEFTVICYGMSYTGEKTSKSIARLDAATPVSQTLQFEFNIENGAEVTTQPYLVPTVITPTMDDKTYFYFTAPRLSVMGLSKEEIADIVVARNKDKFDSGEGLVSGTQDFELETCGGAECILLAAQYEAGTGIAGDVYMADFSTASGGSYEDFADSCTVSISQTANSISAKVTPPNKRHLFTSFIIEDAGDEAANEEAIAARKSELMDESEQELADFKEQYDEHYSIQEIVRYKYHVTEHTFEFDNLKSGKSYIVVTCGIQRTTGKLSNYDNRQTVAL